MVSKRKKTIRNLSSDGWMETTVVPFSLQKAYIFSSLIFIFLLINTSNIWGQTVSTTNYAGTGADLSGVGTAWSYSEKITSKDGKSTSVSLAGNNTSHYLKATNFGFSIPSNATINGITVAFYREASNYYIIDNVVRLVKNGVIQSVNKAKATDWSPYWSGYSLDNYGGSSDLWNTTWTPADINSSNFGVVLSAKNRNYNNPWWHPWWHITAYVDYITITVTYTPVSTPTNSSVFWLKADAGTGATNTGDAIATWSDQSTTGNDGTAQATDPTYNAMLWNFNPSVNFSDGYFKINRGNLQDDMTFYAVTNSTQATSTSSWWTMPAIIGGEAAGVTDDFGLGTNGGHFYFKATSSDNNYLITNDLGNDNKVKIVSATRKLSSSSNNNVYIYVNGKQEGARASDAVSLDATSILGIGRNPTQTSSQFIGGISEVIGQSYLATTSQRWIYETYLAIKYGATLSNDYKQESTTSDSTIYAIAGYSNDIAGLGRNTVFGLNQKVSASSNLSATSYGDARIVMATDSDFISSNLLPGRTSLTNGQYLIWGHDNANINSFSPISGSGYEKVDRVWKVQNTDNVGDVFFQIDLTDFPALPSGNTYMLLTSNSATFDNITAYPLNNTTNELYVTKTSFPAGTGYFTIGIAPNYWIGITSEDWGTNSNWTADKVPNSTEDVVFATASNYSSAAVNNLVLDQNRTINDLTNNSTKQLIIPAGKALTVDGTVTGSETDANKIQIQAASDEATPNGAFIVTNGCTNNNTVYATVQMYAKGKNTGTGYTTWTDNITDSPTEGQTLTTSPYTWQYFGVPVKSIVAHPTFDGSYVQIYSEKKNDPDSYYYKWTALTNSSTLTAFAGYEITQENPKMITIQGKLDFCDATLTLTRSADPTSSSDPNVENKRYGLGQNIFGNSFTAAIPINSLTFPNDVEHTVYLYNTGTFKNWASGSTVSDETTATAGDYLAIPSNVSSAIYSEIPSMQGFLLRNTSPSNATITMDIPYHILSRNTKAQLTKQAFSYLSFNLKPDSANYFDVLWLFSKEGTTDAFNNGWDGKKSFGKQKAFIYAKDEESDPLQVNTSDNIVGTYIYFVGSTAPVYTLTIKKENIDEQYQELYLYDLITKSKIPLDKEIVTYTFAADNNGTTVKRFQIQGGLETAQNKNVDLLTANVTPTNEIHLKNLTDEIGHYYIYDENGRLLKNDRLDAYANFDIHLNLPSGVYIINLTTQQYKRSVKVIIL